MQGDNKTTPWYYGMSMRDLAIHFVNIDGPLSAHQIGNRLSEAGIPIVAKPARAAREGIRRAVAAGKLIRVAEGIYDLPERANGE